MAKQKAVELGTLLQLDPKEVLADDNSRFALKDSQVDSMADSIIKMGGVIEPVEVEFLTEPSNGHKYRLISGFYRHAAVAKLNKDQGAGLTLPALAHQTATGADRLQRQIAENVDRESMSPMDMATAIKRLKDAGVPLMEIRETFKRTGGRKGTRVQPASNEFIARTLSFLELPKAIQKMIHEGVVGWTAAYELTKVNPVKREAIVEAAIRDREQEAEKEEKAEQKFVEAEKKAKEAADKQSASQTELDKYREDESKAKATLETITQAAKAAHEKLTGSHENVTAKKAAAAAFKEAEAARTAAEKAVESASAALDSITKKHEKVAQLAAERAERLRVAREGKPVGAGASKKGAAVTGKDVKKAAAAAGETSQYVALNGTEMKKVVYELTLPGGNETVRQIGIALTDCFMGKTTPKQLYNALAKAVG